MNEKKRNASASAFGWQFQINIAIFLMIKYFGRLKELKVEGEKEDIEILLNNDKKIYAQAKSKQNINDENTSSYYSKLKEALDSLSDVNDKEAEYLIYISNLEPNPLNSGTKEFELVTFLKYNELIKKSQQKIDDQLDKLGKNINKEKLIIEKVPYFGEDQNNRQKFIIASIEDFLAFICPDLLPYKYNFLKILESEALHNSTQCNMKLKMKREDVLWKLLILKLQNSSLNTYDETLGFDEEDFYTALEKYDQIINYKEANFKVYNKINQLITKAQKLDLNINSNKFITIYDNEIYDIVFEDNKNKDMETIEKICSKIIAKKIFIRKRSLVEMFERANKYEN